MPFSSPAVSRTLVSDLPVHLLVFWSEKRSPAEEEGRQGILSVFIFFPFLRRGLEKVTGAINPLAGDSLHPLPGSSGSPGWVSSVCMCLGKGVGGGCVVVMFLALVAARRESERARDREGESERARGAAIAFQGQHIPQEPLLQKHTQAEKGGHCKQRGETCIGG